MRAIFTALLAAAAAASPSPPGLVPPAAAPTSTPADGHALAELAAAALARTEALADGDIVSEAVDGDYRIGLVLQQTLPGGC